MVVLLRTSLFIWQLQFQNELSQWTFNTKFEHVLFIYWVKLIFCRAYKIAILIHFWSNWILISCGRRDNQSAKFLWSKHKVTHAGTWNEIWFVTMLCFCIFYKILTVSAVEICRIISISYVKNSGKKYNKSLFCHRPHEAETKNLKFSEEIPFIFETTSNRHLIISTEPFIQINS